MFAGENSASKALLHKEEKQQQLLPVEHHLCIGDLSSERNHGKHRKRKTKKKLSEAKNVLLI